MGVRGGFCLFCFRTAALLLRRFFLVLGFDLMQPHAHGRFPRLTFAGNVFYQTAGIETQPFCKRNILII